MYFSDLCIYFFLIFFFHRVFIDVLKVIGKGVRTTFRKIELSQE